MLSIVGHLLGNQPPHGHSVGGKSGEGVDGKYCLWDRTLYQEHRLQQGRKVNFFILTDSFESVFTTFDSFSVIHLLTFLHGLIA